MNVRLARLWESIFIILTSFLYHLSSVGRATWITPFPIIMHLFHLEVEIFRPLFLSQPPHV